METAVVFPVVPTPETLLAPWEGVTVSRDQGCVLIHTEPRADLFCFTEVLRLLGFLGRTDYRTEYDHNTGRETFVFDE